MSDTKTLEAETEAEVGTANLERRRAAELPEDALRMDHASQPPGGERPAPLFAGDETTALRGRWTDIQARFVDEPRGSVQAAHQLVSEAMTRLSDMFTSERTNLESQWDRGGDVSTEDLRQALRRYRSFFDRLLSV